MTQKHTVQHYRVELVRDRNVEYPCEAIDGPLAAVRALSSYLSSAVAEKFVVAYLNGANHVLGVETVSMGTMGEAIMSPAEVFRGAILARARGIIVAHNHPSGDCSASDEDEKLTLALVAAGEIVGIPILDHIIVTDTTCCSIRTGVFVDRCEEAA